MNGYETIAWVDGAFAYWAVSDLPRADLESFVAAFRAGHGSMKADVRSGKFRRGNYLPGILPTLVPALFQVPAVTGIPSPSVLRERTAAEMPFDCDRIPQSLRPSAVALRVSQPLSRTALRAGNIALMQCAVQDGEIMRFKSCLIPLAAIIAIRPLRNLRSGDGARQKVISSAGARAMVDACTAWAERNHTILAMSVLDSGGYTHQIPVPWKTPPRMPSTRLC